MRSPTAHTLQYLTARNVPRQVVEQWISVPKHPGGGVRRDLFGFIDIVALSNKVLGIQSTTFGDRLRRLQKIMDAEHTRAWLNAGARLEVWGWKKRRAVKADGTKGKAMRWVVVRIEVFLNSRDELMHRELPADLAISDE